MRSSFTDPPARIESAAVVRPIAGEIVSGDDAFILEIERGTLAAIVDVLGHGEEANALAIRIRAFLTGLGSDALVDVLSRLHRECRGSRGAAVGLCFVEAATGRLRFSGIGNTVFRRFGEVETRLVSRDGTVGGTMRTPVEETLQLSDGDVIVMNTDGVDSHFPASAYPRLRTDRARTVAATIVYRFGKSHDDASCIVLRYQR